MNTQIKPAILFLGSQMTTGGSQHVLLSLARWFHDQGYRALVVFFYDKDGLYAQWQAENPFPIYNLEAWKKAGDPLKYFKLLRGLLRLYKLMRDEKFSAVLTFTHHSNLLGIPLAWLAGVPVRVAAHRGRIYGFRRWQERLHAAMINSGIASCLVAVSQLVRLQSIDEGVRPERIRVIPNGVRLAEVDAQTRSELRRELTGDQNAPIILTAGRLMVEKGHTYLVDAMPAVLERFPQAVFALAGDGPLRPQLEGQARRLGVNGQVRFLGVRKDVQKLMAAADVFVLPSLSEGMPNVLLEAMGMGTLVVASHVGGIGEVVENGRTGLLVPAADSQALSEALVRALGDESERRRMAQAGQAVIHESYPIERMFASYARLLYPNAGQVSR